MGKKLRGKKMKKLLVVLLVLVGLTAFTFYSLSADVQYYSITINVQHLSDWGFARPIEGALVSVSNLDSNIQEINFTDRNGSVVVKLPAKTQYCWLVSTMTSSLKCKLVNYNADMAA
jgi:hypothetical protein